MAELDKGLERLRVVSKFMAARDILDGRENNAFYRAAGFNYTSLRSMFDLTEEECKTLADLWIDLAGQLAEQFRAMELPF